MCYIIELSFNVYKRLNVSYYETLLGDYITSYGGTYYINYEYSETKWKVCSCVITCRFTEQENYIHNITSLIKEVKKIPHIYIESIYEDNIKSKLLYASKYYLKNVDKLEVEQYKKEKRDRSYSDMEIMILNSIIKNHNKERSEELKPKPKSKPKVEYPKSYEEYLKALK